MTGDKNWMIEAKIIDKKEKKKFKNNQGQYFPIVL